MKLPGDIENLKFRSNQSAMVWDRVRDGKGGKESMRVCDAEDARFRKIMDAHQEEAFNKIRTAYVLEYGGFVNTTNLCNEVRGADHDLSGYQVDLIINMRKWLQESRRRFIKLHFILDIIRMGLTLRDLDAKYRVRKGTAKVEVLKALDVYCYMFGMKKDPFFNRDMNKP